MAEAGEPRPDPERFDPARLRAAALREQIEATQSNLEATVSALEGEEGSEAPAELHSASEHAPALDFEAKVEAQQTEADVEAEEEVEAAEEEVAPDEPVVVSQLQGPPPPPGAGWSRTAAALTFAAGVGAGLLLRRR